MMLDESFPSFEALIQNVLCTCPPDDVMENEKGNYCHSQAVGSVGKETPSSKLVHVFNDPH